jgi:cation transport ATPase
VQAFRKAGVSTVAMLTGDSESAAKAVGMRRSDAKIVNFPVYSGV